MRTVPLPIDLGAPSAPAAAPAWKDVRRRVIAEQEGRCPCGKTPKRRDHQPKLDVIRLPGQHLVAMCRKCRLHFDAPIRMMKARRTRETGIVQISLLKKTKLRPRRHQQAQLPRPLTIAELRAEALGRVSPSASAGAGVEAVLAVLVQRCVIR